MSDEEMPVEITPTVGSGDPPMLSRPYFWGATTIMLIWLAVLFIGVFAEAHFRAEIGGDQVEIPVVWGIGLLAFLATWVVAVHSFKSRD
jgi:hypothetical protein